ncbi:MAG: peptide chain release factor 2 [Patescibacteria group bacterium]|jgi:peptide chain release factor 2
MNKDLAQKISDLLARIKKTWTLLDLDSSKTRLKIIESEMSDPDFWKDPEQAKKTSKEHEDLSKELATWKKIQKETEDLLELAKMGEDVVKDYEKLLRQFEKLEFYILLGGKYDKANAVVAIHSGAGGVDAQDWAEMLLRMIIRYAERKDFNVKIIEISKGGEAGIKKAVLHIEGRYAYGYLKSENGVHRLVRISPFDAEAMRHTSFALIEVLPELEKIEDIKIKDEDLRIDVFRAGGHGGQGVNTTDSAVRIVHIPTNITVTCQNERSQHQNKATALKILASKLKLLEEAEKDEEKRKIRGEFTSVEWGSQIRSYVVHPYKMVKDHRTKYEESDPNAVLDGKLEGFVEAFLRSKA